VRVVFNQNDGREKYSVGTRWGSVRITLQYHGGYMRLVQELILIRTCSEPLPKASGVGSKAIQDLLLSSDAGTDIKRIEQCMKHDLAVSQLPVDALKLYEDAEAAEAGD
jgi:hypothetical protein